jgi:hypothetical protein
MEIGCPVWPQTELMLRNSHIAAIRNLVIISSLVGIKVEITPHDNFLADSRTNLPAA